MLRSLFVRQVGRWGGVLALLLALPACSSPAAPSLVPTGSGGALLNVVATTTQIRSMTEAVAGDRAMARSILPPGADAHAFEPKPSAVQAVSAANLLLKNGVGLDDWLDKLLTNAGGTHPLKTISAGGPIRTGDAGEPAGDLHIWFNMPDAMTMIRNIRNALIAVDADHADAYTANADAYLTRLAELDKSMKA